MGMFDFLTVSNKLLPVHLRMPRHNQEYQTKNLDRKCDWYRITKKGMLFKVWRSYHHEHGGDLQVREFVDFTGTIEFYDYYEHHELYGDHTFRAVFEHGKIVGNIEEVVE